VSGVMDGSPWPLIIQYMLFLHHPPPPRSSPHAK
jgi:hypothetical protein